MRPDRSDAHLPPEEQARIELETRRYFQLIAPKRHPKPSRSDGSDDLPNNSSDHISIPELDKLRTLESNPQKLVYQATTEVVDEFVETEYYKDLNCIDKQHHTTGTGFIKVESNGSSSFDLNSVSGTTTAVIHHLPYRGNPATNEWIPSADLVIPASNKPSRSDF